MIWWIKGMVYHIHSINLTKYIRTAYEMIYRRNTYAIMIFKSIMFNCTCSIPTEFQWVIWYKLFQVIHMSSYPWQISVQVTTYYYGSITISRIHHFLNGINTVWINCIYLILWHIITWKVNTYHQYFKQLWHFENNTTYSTTINFDNWDVLCQWLVP